MHGPDEVSDDKEGVLPPGTSKQRPNKKKEKSVRRVRIGKRRKKEWTNTQKEREKTASNSGMHLINVKETEVAVSTRMVQAWARIAPWGFEGAKQGSGRRVRGGHNR